MTIQTATELSEVIERTGADRLFLTISDVHADIRDALGADADEFDIDRIAAEAYDWYAAYSPEDGVEYQHEQGYYQIVTAEEFWEIASQCEIQSEEPTD